MGTLSLWRVRGKMPYRMHEKREFCVDMGEYRVVYVLDINRMNTTLEESRYKGSSLCDRKCSKVSDIRYEGGALLIDTRKGILNIMS
ncbi:MAG: hypothetical protein MJZ38_06470 [archaeon]|nr:hypothetical protein [archaeon]